MEPPTSPSLSLPAPKAVLVICVRYLGDSLLLRPSLRALKKAFPSARVDALITAGTAIALEGCTDVDRVIEWPRGSWLGALATIGKIRSDSYDWVVDYTANDRSALITWLSGAPVRVAYDRPKLSRWCLRRSAYTHRIPPKKKKPRAILQRLELLEACGVPSQGTDIGLSPTPESEAWASAVLHEAPHPRLHAHLTSRDMQKAIPVKTARAVFNDIQRRGGSVVLTSGPSEIERAHVAACAEGFSHVRVHSNLTWHQLVAMIAQADAYWGADTAPAHVASALGKRMLMEFGPSNSAHWHPLNEGGEYLVHPCACLKDKARKCPDGKPGRCLEEAGPDGALEWLARIF